MAIPSIAMIPSGYKASKLYSVLPTDGSGDLDVVRAGATPGFNATRVNSSGLIEGVLPNVPRLDYTNGGCPSLLVEPQRTNLALRSEEFDNASWLKAGAPSPIVTANTTISPDGTTNADTFEITSPTAATRIQQSVTFAAGTYTFSLYVKSLSGLSQVIRLFKFDGTSETNSGDITVTNEWTRITYIFTSLAGSGNISIRSGASNNNVNIAIWGAQLEQGSNATSYIPTVASTVTRNADVISKTGISDLIGQTEGTIFFESKALANSGNFRAISLSDGTAFGGSTNAIELQYSSTANTMLVKVTVNGTATINLPYTITALSFNKFSFKYSSSECSFWLNGVKIATYAGVSFSNNLTVLAFALGNTTSNRFEGNLKNLQVYKTALTDAELETLTTL